MNKYFVLGFFSLLLLGSCSTNFKVGADYKEITVVYGLLSSSDGVNYIKVTKGFFSEEENNLQLAKNSDSLYFKKLQVVLQLISNGNVIRTDSLVRVDLNLEGFPKDSGVFATSPNYAYKYTKPLDASKIYRLRIINTESGKLVEGETPIISSDSNVFMFQHPTNSLTDKLVLANPNYDYQFLWNGPPNATFYDVVIRFWYLEKNANTQKDTLKFKDLNVVQNKVAPPGPNSAELKNTDFFRSLNSALGVAPTGITRLVANPDLLIYAGGDVLKTYMDVNAAQGGITADQIKPNYTNLKSDNETGKNVLGILSTRASVGLFKIKFDGSTIDSIINGQYTRNLGFTGYTNQ